MSLPENNSILHETEDQSRWLHVKEDSILLSDGLLWSTGLVPLPDNSIVTGAQIEDLFTEAFTLGIGSKSTEDLNQKIKRCCSMKTGQIRGWIDHFQKIMNTMWEWKWRNSLESLKKKDFICSEEILGGCAVPVSDSSSRKVSSSASTTNLSLQLLVPMLRNLIEKERETDMGQMTIDTLLDTLLELPETSMSILSEVQKPLNDLQNLIYEWVLKCLSKGDEESVKKGICTMVSLSVSRKSLEANLKCIQLLMEVNSKKNNKKNSSEFFIPVREIIRKLAQMATKIGQPCSLQSSKYLSTWPYNDKISIPKSEITSSPTPESPSSSSSNSNDIATRLSHKNQNCEDYGNHYVATDGTFLYVTGFNGIGLAKIGSGNSGTLRAWNYNYNSQLVPGLIAFGQNVLLSRPPDLDSIICHQNGKDVIIAHVLNSETFEKEGNVIWDASEDFAKDRLANTFGFSSDGKFFYLLRVSKNPSSLKQNDGNPILIVYLDIFSIEKDPESDYEFRAIQLKRRSILLKNEDASQRDPNNSTQTVSVFGEDSIICSNKAGTCRRVSSLIQTGKDENKVGIENSPTSLGFSLKALKESLVFTCGNYLTLIFGNTLITPAKLLNTLGNVTVPRQYSPFGVITSNADNLAIQLHVNLKPNLPDSTIFLKQTFQYPPLQSSFYYGGIFPQMGGTYDSVNNVIWVSNGDYFDCWENPGLVPPWKQKESYKMLEPTPGENEESNMNLESVSNYLIGHIGLMSRHFIEEEDSASAGSEIDIGFSPELLNSAAQIFEINFSHFDGKDIFAFLTLFKAIVSKLEKSGKDEEIIKILKKIESTCSAFLIEIFDKPKEIEDLDKIKKESCLLYVSLFAHLYPDEVSRNSFFNELAQKTKSSGSQLLKETFVDFFSSKLSSDALIVPEGAKFVFEGHFLEKIITESQFETYSQLDRIFDEEDLNGWISIYQKTLPKVTTITNYLASLINYFLRSFAVFEHHPEEIKLEEETIQSIFEIFRLILIAGTSVADRASQNMEITQKELNQDLLISLELILKSSILGQGIIQLILSLSNEFLQKTFSTQYQQIIAEDCVHFAVAISHLSGRYLELVFPSKNIEEDWTSLIGRPWPWSICKNIETVHPLKDTTKLKESFTGSTSYRFYLKFDPRSATQYDYDRVLFSTGPSPSDRRIAEFGGNYYGIGKSNNPGSGWPRSLVRINGNTFSLFFEMRSGREHSTPDKAMWGFRFSVYAIYSTSKETDFSENQEIADIKFMGKLAILSVELGKDIFNLLYQGPPSAPSAKDVSPLFEIGFLNTLKWRQHRPNYHHRFESSQVKLLRKEAGVNPPQIRESLKALIKPDAFEEIYLHTCFKYLGLSELKNEDIFTLDSNSIKKETFDGSVLARFVSFNTTIEILREIFQEIDSIVRRFLALGELEHLFCEEVAELIEGKKTLEEAFFNQNAFRENSDNILNLSIITGIHWEKSENFFSDLQSMVNAFVKDRTPPKLSTTGELIHETVNKLRHLLAANFQSHLTHLQRLNSNSEAISRLKQIFTYTTSHLSNESCTIKSFLKEIKVREERANSRVRAIDLLIKQVQFSKPNWHLINSAALSIQRGIDLGSIKGSGLEMETEDMFGKLLKVLVDISSQNPLLYRYTVGLLCTISYFKYDESSLVKSGLLDLLDKLCAFQANETTSCIPVPGVPGEDQLPPSDSSTINNKASTLAWASFQVLSARCASWEKEKSIDSQSEALFAITRQDTILDTIFSDFFPDSSDSLYFPLPVQISSNVTNHLSRATMFAAMSCKTGNSSDADLASEGGGRSGSNLKFCSSLTDGIQDVLSLLSTLSAYKLGREILKQSPCIAQLLSLLQDPRLSPRLILTIIKLLQTALPLATKLEASDLAQVFPNSKKKSSSISNTEINPYRQIANLLLVKLSDFLVIGASSGNYFGPKCQNDEISNSGKSRVSLYLHRRQDQPPRETIRAIFGTTSPDLQPTRKVSGDMEQELEREKKTLIFGDEEVAEGERKGTLLARSGFVISISPFGKNLKNSNNPTVPSRAAQSPAVKNVEGVEKMTKDRNSILSNNDPSRSFLSGEVAENLSLEIIKLCRTLLATNNKDDNDVKSAKSSKTITSKFEVEESSSIAPSSDQEGSYSVTSSSTSMLEKPLISSQDSKTNYLSTSGNSGSSIHANNPQWAVAVEEAICSCLKKASGKLAQNSILTNLEAFTPIARLAIASLSILGGFSESITQGAEVWINSSPTKSSITSSSSSEESLFQPSYTPVKATVVHISDSISDSEFATVRISEGVKSNELLQVPLKRLSSVKEGSGGQENILPVSLSSSGEKEVCSFFKSLLIPSKEGVCLLRKDIISTVSIPSEDEVSKSVIQLMLIARFLAEIRSKATQVLANYLKKKEFLEAFIGQSSSSSSNETFTMTGELRGMLDQLKALGSEAKSIEKLSSVENQTVKLRSLYRDCTRPLKLTSPTYNQGGQMSSNPADNLLPELSTMTWDSKRPWPPIKSTLFFNDLSKVAFYGNDISNNVNSNASAENPRGLLLFATSAIPQSGFYFEAKIIALGEIDSSTSSSSLPLLRDINSNSPVSIGFSPNITERQTDRNNWRYPAGSVLFHSAGRAAKYTGITASSPIRFPFGIREGDVIGIGWEPLSPPTAQNRTTTVSRAVITPRTVQSNNAVSSSVIAASQLHARRVSPFRRSSNTGISRGGTTTTNTSSAPPSAIPTSALLSRGGGGVQSQQSQGRVFFTFNGRKMAQTIEPVDGGLFPILHIQKTGVILQSNFGISSIPFSWTEGSRFIGISQPLQQGGGGARVSSGIMLRRVTNSLRDFHMDFTNNFQDLFEDIDIDEDESEVAIEFHTDRNGRPQVVRQAPQPQPPPTRYTQPPLLHHTNSEQSSSINDNSSSSSLDHIFNPLPPPQPIVQQEFITQRVTVLTPTLPSSPVEENAEESVMEFPFIDDLPNKERQVAAGKTSKPVNKEYSSTSSLDYFLRPSSANQIRVFSGPNRYPCPSCRQTGVSFEIYSESSPTSHEENSSGRPDLSASGNRTHSHSNNDSEDIHDLLVHAWEVKVFPIIRRRFRTESERRDGLDQIRGALQLGMFDIAHQTVQYLYEDTGIPRDLHLPTIDDIKAEANLLNKDSLKVEQLVLIKALEENENGMIIPKWATGSMLRTFGLSGEVLEVDLIYDLALVEIYVESEGILVRYWFPLNYLEKPGSTRQRNTSKEANSINMFKLHSNLLKLENSMNYLNCRKIYLQILNHFHSAGESIFEKIATKELSLENCQLLSVESFADFPLNGDLLTWNLKYGSPSLQFLKNPENPSVIFYKDVSQLSYFIQSLLNNSIPRGQNYLNSVAASFISIFSSEKTEFQSRTLPFGSKDEEDEEILFEDASFILISPKVTHALGGVNYSHPSSIHIYGYDSSELKKTPLLCYPVDVFAAAATGNNGNNTQIGPGLNPNIISRNVRNNSATASILNENGFNLPTVLVPTNRINFKASNDVKGFEIEFFGIPSELPLALFFIQKIIENSLLQQEGEGLYAPVINDIIKAILSFLNKIILPPLIKEWLFSLLSELIRLTDDKLADSLVSESVSNAFFTEALLLFENETKNQTLSPSNSISGVILDELSMNPPPPPKRSLLPAMKTSISSSNNQIQNLVRVIGANKDKSQRGFPALSSYLQALIELNMCIGEIKGLPALVFNSGSLIPEASPPVQIQNAAEKKPTASQMQIKPYQPPITLQIPAPTTATTQNARKMTRLASRVIPIPNTNKIAPSSSSAAKSVPATNKTNAETILTAEQIEWFKKAFYGQQTIKKIHEGKSSRDLIDLLKNMSKERISKMSSPTAADRLFVLINTNEKKFEPSIENTLNSVLREAGGIYGNGREFYINENSDIVLEIRSASKAVKAQQILRVLANQTRENLLLQSNVYGVDYNFNTGNKRADDALDSYLIAKIADPENQKLSKKGVDILTEIFTSCFIAAAQIEMSTFSEASSSDGTIWITSKFINSKANGNLLEKFVNAVKPDSSNQGSYVEEILQKYGDIVKKSNNKDSETTLKAEFPSTSSSTTSIKSKYKLCQSGFFNWVEFLFKENIKTLWRGLLACGFDLRLDKAWVCDDLQNIVNPHKNWGFAKDAALVKYLDKLSSYLRISPTQIHPSEIYLSSSDLSDPEIAILSEFSIEIVRTRAAILQSLNSVIFYHLLPLLSFVNIEIFGINSNSTANLVHKMKHLLFYNTIDEFLLKVLKYSAYHSTQTLTPELTLDPIKHIGNPNDASQDTLCAQVISQLSSSPSSLMCTLPAKGGDPILPLSVKFIGEEVHGIIGSFRHNISEISKEISGDLIKICSKCPSSFAGTNKDMLIVTPGSLTFGEESFLQFFGQIFGISLRSDFPLALTLSQPTWSSFLEPGKLVLSDENLAEIDVLTAKYLKDFETVETKEAFELLLDENESPKFQCMSMDGKSMVPLSEGSTIVNWQTKAEYIQLVKKFRGSELKSTEKMREILSGLATCVPLPGLFTLFSPDHLRLRISGAVQIDLNLLKSHTHYQAGINESDPHILLFWEVLESLSPEEMQKFIKFASNQDRLPVTCPCQNSPNGHFLSSTHVPPFPMKISPMDISPTSSQDQIDRRLIRVETCLFLIRLPAYSSFHIMKTQILTSANSLNDPLSG